MIWATSGVAFAAVVLIVLAVAYGFSGASLPAAERLTRLWQPPSADKRLGFRDKQKQKVQQMLGDVGRLVPTSSKRLPHTQRLMARAGFRRPESIMAMQGVKVLLPVGLVALVYFTGLYHQSPVFLLAVAAIGGYLLPEFWLTARVRSRQQRLRLSLPDCLDLLVVCVEAGLALDQSFMRVTQELRIVHRELCEELDLVNAEIRIGRTRLEALRELGDRTGVDDIKSLVAMLIQTDRFGTSVAQSLRVHSDELRTKRRQRAEEMAAKATVKMIPPLVFFVFPALFVVILGPAVVSLYRHFM
ncbi:MAG: type II secretion system F family protein [Terriglobia bacterium]|jgi:tight adherence protein C